MISFHAHAVAYHAAADPARLYIVHKADMATGSLPDGEMIAHINDITSTLIVLGRMARANDHWPWLLRHKWRLDAVGGLFDDQRAVPPDA